MCTFCEPNKYGGAFDSLVFFYRLQRSLFCFFLNRKIFGEVNQQFIVKPKKNERNTSLRCNIL